MLSRPPHLAGANGVSGSAPDSSETAEELAAGFVLVPTAPNHQTGNRSLGRWEIGPDVRESGTFGP